MICQFTFGLSVENLINNSGSVFCSVVVNTNRPQLNQICHKSKQTTYYIEIRFGKMSTRPSLKKQFRLSFKGIKKALLSSDHILGPWIGEATSAKVRDNVPKEDCFDQSILELEAEHALFKSAAVRLKRESDMYRFEAMHLKYENARLVQEYELLHRTYTDLLYYVEKKKAQSRASQRSCRSEANLPTGSSSRSETHPFRGSSSRSEVKLSRSSFYKSQEAEYDQDSINQGKVNQGWKKEEHRLSRLQM